MSEDKKVQRLRSRKPCPICAKPSTQAFHPFCTSRCADVDLNRWLTGSYVIPVRDDEPTDEADRGAEFDDDV